VNELIKQSACAVVAKLKSGEISIQDTLDVLQKRIETVDGQVNALPTLCFERASIHATQLQSQPVDKRGKLYGLPVSIKDLTDQSAGHPYRTKWWCCLCKVECTGIRGRGHYV